MEVKKKKRSKLSHIQFPITLEEKIKKNPYWLRWENVCVMFLKSIIY
jgi:hypothetical protein